MADEDKTPTETPETPQEETAPPAAEAPKAEAPAVEEKKAEAPVAEAPKEEAPKKEAPAVEEKKAATPVAGEAAEEGKPRQKSAIELLLDPNAGEAIKIVKAKGSKNVTVGIAHVFSTFNNTKVSITDPVGNVIGWSSGGKVGFKGSRKSTAYAAQMVAQDAARQAMGHGLKEVEVRVKGPGSGRESAVRALQAIGLEINLIKDVTPVPHNGCRPPKQRRV